MTVSIRLTAEDEKLFKTYAKNNNISISELVRSAVLEKIEEEYDLEVYRQAYEEYQKNPITYSHDEICEMLDIE